MKTSTLIAAFALSLAMTLGIFSSVTGLSAPSHAGAQLAQAGQALQQAQPAQDEARG